MCEWQNTKIYPYAERWIKSDPQRERLYRDFIVKTKFNKSQNFAWPKSIRLFLEEKTGWNNKRSSDLLDYHSGNGFLDHPMSYKCSKEKGRVIISHSYKNPLDDLSFSSFIEKYNLGYKLWQPEESFNYPGSTYMLAIMTREYKEIMEKQGRL